VYAVVKMLTVLVCCGRERIASIANGKTETTKKLAHRIASSSASIGYFIFWG
jgi:hypothetical protein